MIWSIIPESVIFNDAAEQQGLQSVSFRGRQVLIRASGGRGEIISLLSTDPADFLSPCFMPGTMIDVR